MMSCIHLSKGINTQFCIVTHAHKFKVYKMYLFKLLVSLIGVSRVFTIKCSSSLTSYCNNINTTSQVYQSKLDVSSLHSMNTTSQVYQSKLVVSSLHSMNTTSQVYRSSPCLLCLPYSVYTQPLRYINLSVCLSYSSST